MISDPTEMENPIEPERPGDGAGACSFPPPFTASPGADPPGAGAGAGAPEGLMANPQLEAGGAWILQTEGRERAFVTFKTIPN